MILLRSIVARLLGALGILLFAFGAGLVALAYYLSPCDDYDLLAEPDFMKTSVSPSEKHAEN